MPRLLFLVSFLVVCLLALPGADLFAAQTGGKDPAPSFKSSDVKSSTTLARLLKNSHPLTSATCKPSSKKSKTGLKTASSKSKKGTIASHHKSHKLAYTKSKSSKRGACRKSRLHKKSKAGKISASKRLPHSS